MRICIHIYILVKIYAKDSSDSFASFLSHGSQLVKKIEDAQLQLNELEPKVVSCIHSGRQLANQLIPNIIEMKSLHTSLKVAEREELISRYRSEVDAALVLGAFEMALSSFSNLSIHLGTHISSIHPPPATLPTFYRKMLDFFCRKFQETLQRMDIPRTKPASNWLEDGIGRLGDRCPWDEETLRAFCCQYKALNSIKLPETLADTDAAKRARLSIPMRLILEPLEKRFLFNFYGTQLTNKPEKPEWYFTEVLTWITINDQWLTWMQDEQLKDVEFSSTLRVEFMQGLISFVVDKISYDLGLLSSPPKPRCAVRLQGEEAVQELIDTGTKNQLLTSPPAFFGHLADEMLAFESRLDGLYYHPNALRPADLFTHRIDVLQHWLFLESEAAHNKVKELLAKPYAWNMDNKVPQCVGDFVALVYAISRRGAQLQHNAAKPRAYFFKIQLDLIFTFLEALTRLLPWNSSSTSRGTRDLAGDELVGWTSIVNAMHAMVETMQDWTNDQYFVELWEDQESRSLLSCSWDPWIEDEMETRNEAASGWKTISQRLNSALEETAPPREAKLIADSRIQCPGVFSKMSELYRQKIDQCLQKVSQSVFAHLQKLAQDYLSDGQHWSQVSGGEGSRESGSPASPFPPSGLSGQATELFVQLSHNLFATSKYLHSRLFVRLWRPTLQQLNQFLYKNLILRNRFTQAGANQLKYDLEHCLHALLVPYSTLLPIDDLLAECLDACRLLTLPPGSLCLLKQALRGEDLTASVLGPLVELGIRRLTPEDALDVISRYISPSGAF
uniref:RAD50-interacting protein 1 n=1 Tax=Mesocestoides corti TaxID=53468 RepID=A0A5K3FJ80_MESCO